MISRRAVYWYGDPPNEGERREFANRGLIIYTEDVGGGRDLTIARAVVYCGRPPSVAAAAIQPDDLIDALDNGLLVYLIAADDAIQAHLLRSVSPVIRDGPLHSMVRSRTGPIPPHECAETIARHDPGLHANQSLEIQVPPHLLLGPDQEFLVRRAFSDCSKVVLEPLTGGRSASVFLAQATLILSEAGPRPMPFL